eukprot:COSAG02_NODE_29048_length_577_cov_0.370293_1_plen_50_part_10
MGKTVEPQQQDSAVDQHLAVGAPDLVEFGEGEQLDLELERGAQQMCVRQA